MKLGDLARQLDCELRGPSEIEIDGLAGIEEATATQLTFVSNPKYYSKIPSTRAGAVVVSRDAPDNRDLPTLISDNPYLAFARAIPLFYRPPSVTRRNPPHGHHRRNRRTGRGPLHRSPRRHRRRGSHWAGTR